MLDKFMMNDPYEKRMLEAFRILMYDICGITYSKRTFNRRFDLMTKAEKKYYTKKIHDLFDKIDQHVTEDVENIDEIMSNRAEIAKDKWP